MKAILLITLLVLTSCASKKLSKEITAEKLRIQSIKTEKDFRNLGRSLISKKYTLNKSTKERIKIYYNSQLIKVHLLNKEQGALNHLLLQEILNEDRNDQRVSEIQKQMNEVSKKKIQTKINALTEIMLMVKLGDSYKPNPNQPKTKYQNSGIDSSQTRLLNDFNSMNMNDFLNR